MPLLSFSLLLVLVLMVHVSVSVLVLVAFAVALVVSQVLRVGYRAISSGSTTSAGGVPSVPTRTG